MPCTTMKLGCIDQSPAIVGHEQFRSSFSVDPQTGKYSGLPSPTGIIGDPALTSHGVDQSRQLAKHLLSLDPPIDAVYSSPYYRCLQTMQPYMGLLQQQIAETQPMSAPSAAKMMPEDGIREWFGSAPFEHPVPASPQVLKDLFPTYDDTYVSTVTPSPKGETLQELQARITTALRGIIARAEADGSRAIVLCSHAAVIILMGRILTGKVPSCVDIEDFHAFTCGLSVYSRGARNDSESPEAGKPTPGSGAKTHCR